MRGDKVLARAFGDEARIVRLLGISGQMAVITDEEGLTRLNSGEYAVKRALFPIEFVFVYTETVNTGDMPDWSRLTPLTALLVAGSAHE